MTKKAIGTPVPGTDLEVTSLPEWKFREDELLKEVEDYIIATYGQHYAGNSGDLQTFELIAKDSRVDRGLSFALGSMMKYADRTPLKAGNERKDILKAIHFGYLALYCWDKLEAKRKLNTNETL